ncbi:MAG: phosphoribosylaminoimidazolesuccinocarboxamide synthase [bacterium]
MEKTEVTKGQLIYDGKAKKVYATSNPNYFIQEFKDDASVPDDIKTGAVRSKGICNNRISAICFNMLERRGVPTFFVELLGEREMVVRKLEIFPIDIVVRNVAAGSLCSRLDLTEGMALPFPVVEFHLKDDKLRDPLINHDHIKIITSVTEGEVKVLESRAKEINCHLKNFFYERNLILVEFKLEFGKDISKRVRLGDEISPDTCLLWDRDSYEKLDKDRFRRDLRGAEEAYQEVLKRVSAA